MARSLLQGFSRQLTRPYLEIEEVIASISKHEDVMKKRKMRRKPDLTRLSDLFQRVNDLKVELVKITKEKDENAGKVQEMIKSSSDKIFVAEIQALREKGRDLRDEARKVSTMFQEVSDTLVGLVLAIPNQLDPVTPLEQYEKLGAIPVKSGVEPFKLPLNFSWEYLDHVGPNAEYAVGPGALWELDVATMCQKFLLSKGFAESGNVDFVKSVLLEGTALDAKQFIKVREVASKTGKHHATYLVGGATFPAFLALFAQSVIQQKEILPIRYFVIGRAYTKSKNNGKELIPVQNTIVQVFVACKDQEQEEEEFSTLLEVMNKFYCEEVGIETESRLLPAPELKTYEKKRVAFVQADRKVVGDLATTGDYVSKRLLCCYNDRQVPKFLHLITGQLMNTSDLIRSMLPQESKKR